LALEGEIGINMSKSTAFILCLISIMVIFISMFTIAIVRDEELSIVPVSSCLTAAVGITTAFMGIQMANNGIKGRNWNQDMFDSENSREGEK